jgi:isopenicillin N synthase-like dioxygenase
MTQTWQNQSAMQQRSGICFQITNHGVPIEVFESVKEARHRFFRLSVEEKRKFLKENSPSYSLGSNKEVAKLGLKSKARKPF